MEHGLIRYHLFAMANFLAAFGGGMILGKGINVINTPFLQNGFLIAFFAGSVLGLVFLQSIPENLSKSLMRWFSIGCGITSLILFYIFEKLSIDGTLSNGGGLLFFFFLIIRFGFWFYSRVRRASIAAGLNQRIAWVELGYYAGMIFGLIIWKFLGIEIGVLTALMMDSILQFCAGLLDLKASKTTCFSLEKLNIDYEENNAKFIVVQNDVAKWIRRLSVAVILLTIGVQVIIFNLIHHVSEHFGAYILATYYFSVSTAAFICKKHKINISWNEISKLAIISSTKIKLKLPLFVLLSAVSVSFLIFCVNCWSLDTTDSVFYSINVSRVLIFSLIFISAFFYEILALAILDRLGFEEKKSAKKNIVIRTYGLMGIGAAISLWLLGISNNAFVLIATSIISLTSSGLIIFKRMLY